MLSSNWFDIEQLTWRDCILYTTHNLPCSSKRFARGISWSKLIQFIKVNLTPPSHKRKVTDDRTSLIVSAKERNKAISGHSSLFSDIIWCYIKIERRPTCAALCSNVYTAPSWFFPASEKDGLARNHRGARRTTSNIRHSIPNGK